MSEMESRTIGSPSPFQAKRLALFRCFGERHRWHRWQKTLIVLRCLQCRNPFSSYLASCSRAAQSVAISRWSRRRSRIVSGGRQPIPRSVGEKHVHRNSREGSRCMIPGICDFRLTLELLAANGCELQHRQYRSRAQLLDRAVDFGVTLAVLMGQTDRRGTEPRRRVQKMLELQHPLPLWARRSRPRTNPKSSASAVPPLSRAHKSTAK